mmetsp:Transcript_15558/g.51127  ORF Transcript_15558/g.51127 Transcript_15558/m.51127 type:complete len:258 (-) Transcript_15558:764-1537(-)
MIKTATARCLLRIVIFRSLCVSGKCRPKDFSMRRFHNKSGGGRLACGLWCSRDEWDFGAAAALGSVVAEFWTGSDCPVQIERSVDVGGRQRRHGKDVPSFRTPLSVADVRLYTAAPSSPDMTASAGTIVHGSAGMETENHSAPAGLVHESVSARTPSLPTATIVHCSVRPKSPLSRVSEYSVASPRLGRRRKSPAGEGAGAGAGAGAGDASSAVARSSIPSHTTSSMLRSIRSPEWSLRKPGIEAKLAPVGGSATDS